MNWLTVLKPNRSLIIDTQAHPFFNSRFPSVILSITNVVLTFLAMRNCDETGPLMMYVSKMVPSSDKNRFYAFGRVFSGTVATQQKVRIMGPNYDPSTGDRDLTVKSLPHAVVMVGASAHGVETVPCGNVCALSGVDKYLLKTGTISTYEQAHNLKVLKSPFV